MPTHLVVPSVVDVQHGIDGEVAGEGKVADEFRGPLVDAVNTGVVGEHAEAGALEVVDCAHAAEIVAGVVAAERMTIGCQHREIGQQRLFGMCPYGRTDIGFGVHACSQKIATATIAVFSLPQRA